MDSESEWNTNKKLVTVTAADGLSKAVSKPNVLGLPMVKCLRYWRTSVLKMFI